ncbi:PLC-like phosphodiesterase family protein, putative isoform 2 [Hibiscus syriacus]|uniref:glycerophosphodiester phosphodiesterase n=1 Tax=Hibiscus syriacus TaxID=106335 RepID=A0A6A3C890_HIBSY|nr:PLC-like phosphodiesterase family protein, putative isoform 2 [Hibiscus syriacus]
MNYNDPYLAEQGFGVTDAVLDALSKAGYDKQTAQKVIIQSSNSSVLMKFKGKANYQLVYEVDEDIGGAQISTIDDIKRFASAVVISKDSVFPENSAFLVGTTDVYKGYKLLISLYLFKPSVMSLHLKHETSSLMQPLRSIPSTREPTEADVVEPPLPPVAAKTPTSTPSGTTSAPRSSPNGQPKQ